ncbi:MAG TPA: aminotransferase class I/II-fold pyridoxal phosphate-dependent enzyme, partial [Polyangiaceae bacterium]
MPASPIPIVRHGGIPPSPNAIDTDLVDASASINPLGAPPWLRQEVSRWLSAVQHYPDARSSELAHAIATANGCLVESVVIGNGSSELLAWLPQVTAQSIWLVPVPSFGEYRRAPALAGRKVVEVPLAPDAGFACDWEQLDRALTEPSVVVLGHPNNPTGTLLCPEALHALRARHPRSLFVVDEAFGDFVEGFRSVWSDAAENLIVLRSLTKILAIAGLRLGYALMNSEIAERLRQQLPPWSVNLLAQRVGIRFFAEPSHAAVAPLLVAQLRRSLAAQLRALQLGEVHESAANWLLLQLRTDGPTASELVTRCRELGVALRSCSDFPGLGEQWLRISVRDAEQNVRIADALGEVFGRPTHRTKAPARHAIMLQGCSSDAGKSILTTALCRCLVEDGYRVAPFKAQNMSNNSGVAADGGEMGRAQVLQALACKIEPDTRMNPILLK